MDREQLLWDVVDELRALGWGPGGEWIDVRWDVEGLSSGVAAQCSHGSWLDRVTRISIGPLPSVPAVAVHSRAAQSALTVYCTARALAAALLAHELAHVHFGLGPASFLGGLLTGWADARRLEDELQCCELEFAVASRLYPGEIYEELHGLDGRVVVHGQKGGE